MRSQQGQTVSGSGLSSSFQTAPTARSHEEEPILADLVFVLLTIGLFAILAIVVRLVERL